MQDIAFNYNDVLYYIFLIIWQEKVISWNLSYVGRSVTITFLFTVFKKLQWW